MAVIGWDALTKRFTVNFDKEDCREGLTAAIRATPETTIHKEMALDIVPVEATPGNIAVLWASGYAWQGQAAEEALSRVMPLVQKHLFTEQK